MTDALQRRRQARGSNAEQFTELRLRQMGLVLIEKVEVGCKLIAGRRIYTKPVSGDYRAVIPGLGRSVLVEVKCRDDDRLSCSDLRPHQRQLLTLHMEANGASILAWYHIDALVLMDWRRIRDHFEPRMGMSWSMAQDLQIPPGYLLVS